MKKIGIAVLTTAAMAFALPAAAQSVNTNAFYAGANIGQSKFKVDCQPGQTCDDSDTAFKIFGGYSFNKNWAAEFGYNDFGKAKITEGALSAEVKANAWDLDAVFSWPFADSGFSIFGRAGLYMGETKFSGDASGSKSTTDLTYGIGGQYDFSRNLGLRAEWQRFSKMKAHDDSTGDDSSGDVDALTIGVIYRFQ
jgi:OOP family OmpA-OmpF porin